MFLVRLKSGLTAILVLLWYTEDKNKPQNVSQKCQRIDYDYIQYIILYIYVIFC